MILFFAEGRLGNQIFQYVFLKTIQKDDDKIIVSGFDELKEVFEIDDIVNIHLDRKNRWIEACVSKVCYPVLVLLSDKNIISTIKVEHENVFKEYRRESVTYSEKKGLLRHITFVSLGFFQSEMFFKKEIASTLQIKDMYQKLADESLNTIPKGSHKVFVHIRRSDYKDHKIYGKSALLPMKYYKEQIDYLSEHRENCFFIFLSDEPDLIKEEFAHLDKKLIVADNHFGVDLAIMTKCNSAVLSPSSFGWWGSYLMRDRDIVFAPRHWLGFASKVDYHAKPLGAYMTEVEI